MKRSVSLPLCIVGAMLLGVPAAHAVTLTFDDIDYDYLAESYVENGVLVKGNGQLGVYTQGSIYLSDGGTGAPQYLSFTTGGLFDVLSFDLMSYGFKTAEPFENVLLTAYHPEGPVETKTFQMGPNYLDTSTIVPGPMFTNLTEFVIGFAELPPWWDGSTETPAGNYCYDNPCTDFEVDNVALNFVTPAIVPLPAGLVLLASAIAGLGFVRRSQKT